MKWKRVIDELPKIPKNKYAVSVLIAEFDPCYDECLPGQGYSVRYVSYGKVDYRRMSMFEGSKYPDGTNAFMDLCTSNSFKYGYEWSPCGKVTHWMYLPKAPKYDPEVINPIFKWYYENAVPQSPLKEI